MTNHGYYKDPESGKARRRELYALRLQKDPKFEEYERQRKKRYQSEHREEIRAYNKERGKQWYRDNREQSLANHKKWVAANHDRLLEYQRKYLKEHREHYSELAKQSRIRNADKIRKRARERWHNVTKNSQAYLLYKKKWYAANKKKVQAKCKLYRSRHKDRMDELSRNRRASKRAAEGTHTHEDIMFLFEYQNKRCANPYCRKRIYKSGKRKYQVDHILALNDGGSNYPGNIQLLCQRCNISKHDYMLHEWLEKEGKRKKSWPQATLHAAQAYAFEHSYLLH